MLGDSAADPQIRIARQPLQQLFPQCGRRGRMLGDRAADPRVLITRQLLQQRDRRGRILRDVNSGLTVLIAGQPF